MSNIGRRDFIKNSGLALLALTAPPVVAASSESLISKPIPTTGEPLVSVGMGTWQTFNVGSDQKLRDHRCQILQTFFGAGGQIIDSSPMYGSSHEVVGYCLKKLGFPDRLFSADKIWTSDGDATRSQFQAIASHWNQPKLDLMQVHNLVSWEEHLETLKKMKQQGTIRYLGITTSHGRRHNEFEQIMRKEPLDFVQLTYNIRYREVEARLLPLAKEKGIAVIANRPFDGGHLPRQLQGNQAPLPSWAADIQCQNWPQFLLKFITSHPAITCAIPATTQIEHMQENMGAAKGELPDEKMRQKMLRYFQSL
ncbi:MAG: aldo/keto reductase [Ketobacteraceae bacterium]|nr:aldo/keto reductase [Ketobacteraceae bacterium]